MCTPLRSDGVGWQVRFSTGASFGTDELVASRLWDLGTTGIAEIDGELVAGFESEHRARLAAAALTDRPAEGHHQPVVVRSIEPIGWSGDRRRRAVTVPTSDGDLTVFITPGPTFGHGGHATTRLALRMLVATVAPGASVLDVGTGSGILAIVAAKRGAASVTAIDTDRRAIVTALANATANDVELICTTATVAETGRESSAGLDGGFDVVVANVLAATHHHLADDVAGAVAGNGSLLTTGYLGHQAAAVVARYRAAFARSGRELSVVEAVSCDGWAGHHARASAAVTGGVD